MNASRTFERGQAIVILAITLVILLGFAGLAIDGGMVYSDRRRAQNAADAAALAGALQKVNYKPNSQVIQAITYSLQGNGYNPELASWEIEQRRDFSGKYFLVTVEMTTTTPTSFVQLIFGGEMRNHVMAIARARHTQPVLPNMAIVGMGNCVQDDDTVVNGEGGGNSGGVRTFEGGIFVNSPESAVPPMTERCALDPSNNGHGIQADPDWGVSSVGGYDYAGVPGISPSPVYTGTNGGVPIDDPLIEIKEPTCPANAVEDAGLDDYVMDKAGRVNVSASGRVPSGMWAPGIYCIYGSISMSGNDIITGEGVLLYFVNGGMNGTGNSYIQIAGPNPTNCLPANPYTSDFSFSYLSSATSQSCTYNGFAIFAARNNHSTIEIRGNGGNAVRGLVYVIGGTVQARGGGSNPEDAIIIGQVVANAVDTRGGGDIKVTYSEDYTFWKPPELSLER